MDIRSIPLILWLILGFVLLISWPSNLDLVLIILWVLPVLFFWLVTTIAYNPPFWLMGAALVLSIIGIITELNILKDFALATAIASFLPFSFINLIWLLGSFFWIPSSGWILSQINLNSHIVQIVAIVIVTLLALWDEWRQT